MTRISRRRLLGGIAAASLPVALPAGAEGKPDVEIVQMLIDAHKATMVRWDDAPEGTCSTDDPLLYEICSQMDRAAAALCFYRPTTLEGIHAKAAYMHGCDAFVEDDYFTRAELIGGFVACQAQ